MTRLIIIVSFIISVTVGASYMKRESYIDMPSANFSQGLYFDVSSSYPIRDVADVKFDPNFGIDFSYNGFGIALKWYNGADFALDFSYQLLGENGSYPSLAVGISEVTVDKYVSPAGFDEVFNDENYTDRPPEVASAYIVATKKISENFDITAGMGRGKFVGYGPRSQHLNIDAFSDETHGNWAFGLFGGMKASFLNGLGFIVEADGRDANLGVEYQNDLVKGTLALNKLELFGSERDLSPRLSLDLSYKIADMKGGVEESKKLTFAIELIDNKTRESVAGNIVLNSRQGENVEISLNRKIHSFSLKPDKYTAHITSEGYIDKDIEVTVKRESKDNLYTVELNKKEIPKKIVEAKDSIKIVDNFDDIKNTVEGINVQFAFKKFDLSMRAYGILDRIVELIRDNKDTKLMVIGHTCSIGSYQDNQELSEKRAEVVKEYLIGRGISPDRIVTEAYGETRPIASNSTEEGRVRNRRVQFILYRVKK